MNFMGEVALDGDVVLCKCARPPRIVANLAGDVWFDDMDAGHGATDQPDSFDEMVVAVSTDGPVTDYPYFVETSDGRGLFGYTDAGGNLPRVTTLVAGSLTVYWGDEALVRHWRERNA